MSKKIVCTVLSIVLLVTYIIPLCVIAADISTSGQQITGTVLTDPVSEDIKKYAIGEYSDYLSMIARSPEAFGVDNFIVENCYLGSPIKAYNEDVYYFPVYCGERAIGIIIVSRQDGGFNSNYAKWFADELNALYANGNDEFVFIATGQSLIAIGEKNQRILSSSNANAVAEQKMIADATATVDQSNMQEVTPNDMLYVKSPNVVLADPDTPIESRTLAVTHVHQNGKNICWAASCAMIINFIANPTYWETAESIALRITGSDNTPGWPWYIGQAYAYHGLNYSTDGALSYAAVKAQINNRRPVHMSFYQNGDATAWHCCVLRGYETSASGSQHYFIFDPNYTTSRSMSAAPDVTGRIYYVTPGGIKYAWAQSFYNIGL